jgi:hypothetical protein
MTGEVNVVNNTASIGIGVKFDNILSTGIFKITVDQDSLQLSKTANDTVKLALVWGTF